jgi:2-amino-4-hydroxy-6-hydroxymethyldihydropteridine diphosphokinase
MNAASVPVFVAAGSNVEPFENLRTALAALRARFGALRVSRAYANTAVGFEGPDFINLVVGFQTDRSLSEVLAALHEVESACGRGRTAPKWAPRRMDLDLLLFGDLTGSFPGAELPRPDLLRRAFMLGPLAEIAPDVAHPTLGTSLGELWSKFDREAHPLRPVELDQ